MLLGSPLFYELFERGVEATVYVAHALRGVHEWRLRTLVDICIYPFLFKDVGAARTAFERAQACALETLYEAIAHYRSALSSPLPAAAYPTRYLETLYIIILMAVGELHFFASLLERFDSFTREEYHGLLYKWVHPDTLLEGLPENMRARF